ncbi:MAG: permease, partial [Planctomycetales bacterium]|nr:permease [Planctomycetales bacterium]
MTTITAGMLLRFIEAALAAAPTLLIGAVVAGVLRHLVGTERTRQLFGGETWRGQLKAWAWGMLLPVCSLGVFPIMAELRRSKVSTGSIITFALTAPLFNPLSLLYGFSLATPGMVFAFAFASLIIV